MKIAVVGAGIGGLAAASLLADQGFSIDLFDQFDKPLPLGSGLVLQPVGQAVLQVLGEKERAALLGKPIWRMRGWDRQLPKKSEGLKARVKERPVLDVSYGRAQQDAPGLGIHRAALFQTLLDAAMKRSSIRFHSGMRISAISSDHRSLIVETGGDPGTVQARGKRPALEQVSGEFDLIIDAAGARSSLSPLTAKPLHYGALWGSVAWPAKSALSDRELTQCYRRASNMAGVLPIGRIQANGNEQAAIFWSLPLEQHPRVRCAGIDRWREQATALWPAFAPFIEQLQSFDQLTLATYSHGTLRRPYRRASNEGASGPTKGGCLVHIGDAAHRASPQLGQGANMALLDAYALSLALANLPVEKALPAFYKARRWHVGAYQLMSKVFTPMYQSDSKILPIIRDRLMYPASRLPPMQKLLTQLVSGTMLPAVGGLAKL